MHNGDQIWHRNAKKISELIRRIPVRYFDDAQTMDQVELMQTKGKTLSLFVSSFIGLFSELVSIASIVLLAITTSKVLLIAVVIFIMIAWPIYNGSVVKTKI